MTGQPSPSIDPLRLGRVAVVGSINLDWVVRCDAIPRPGETVHGRSLEEIPGGKGANQAVAAARLGARVEMIGRLGEDAFAGRLRQYLRGEGIGTDSVLATPNVSSGLAIISVDDAGENAITVVSGANGLLTPDDIEAAADRIADASVVMLQLEIPMETVLAAIAIARRAGTRVLLDPAPAPRDFPAELLQVDWLCPNETEAMALTGMAVDSGREALAAAQRLCELGVGCVLLTRGARGVAVATADGQTSLLPSPRVAAVDSTAAGDAFAGAFAARIALGDELSAAAAYAVLAGAHAVTVHGAQTSIPRPADIEKLKPTTGQL
jgi:ribokinase